MSSTGNIVLESHPRFLSLLLCGTTLFGVSRFIPFHFDFIIPRVNSITKEGKPGLSATLHKPVYNDQLHNNDFSHKMVIGCQTVLEISSRLVVQDD